MNRRDTRAAVLSVMACLPSCAHSSPPPLLWDAATDPPSQCNWKEPGCHPTKQQVMKAMADVTPAVSECLHARQGILQTCMEFGSDGVVVKAGKSWKGRGCTEFEEGPLAGPSEPCVKAALLGVRVPPFKAERFRLSYPFKAGG